MGKTLEDIANRHGLNIATDAPYTLMRRDNSRKSTKEIETIKTASSHRN